VSQAESALTNVGASVSVTPSVNASVGNEVTAVAVQTGSGTVVFATFNSNFGSFLPDGNKTHCGWAKSNSSQTSFTSYDSYYNPLPIPTMSSGSPYERCLGDTWAAALGPQRQSQAVMVAVAQANDDTRDVVLWVTNNGGTSFTSATTISTLPTGAGADGPKVAIDATNNAAYVWWANEGSNGIKTHYLRRANIALNGSVSLGPLQTLTNKLPGTATPLHAVITIRKAVGTALPRIFLAYPTAGMSLIPDCFNNPSQTGVVNWYLAYSDNGGSTWTSHLVDTDPAFPMCQFQSPSNDEFLKRLGGNRSYISAVYDGTTGGSGRVLLAYQRHEDDENGDYVGTRINVAHWPSEPMGIGFDRWKPACNPAICPPSGGNCLVDGRLPAGETYCTQYGQSVAVRGAGGASQMAIVWHDTRDTPSSHPQPMVGDATSRNIVKSDIWGVSVRPGEPKDTCTLISCPKTQSRITPLSSTVPWLPTATNGNLWWGDYEQGIATLGNNFFAVWADNRDQSLTTRIRGAAFDYGQAP